MKTKKRELSIPTGLALGILVSIVITLLGAVVTAWLVISEKIGEGSFVVTAAFIQLLSGAMGALCAMLSIKKRRLQVCLLSGVIYYLVLLGINALLFDGSYEGLGLTALMVLLGSSLVAFIPMGNSQSSKKRKKAYR